MSKTKKFMPHEIMELEILNEDILFVRAEDYDKLEKLLIERNQNAVLAVENYNRINGLRNEANDELAKLQIQNTEMVEKIKKHYFYSGYEKQDNLKLLLEDSLKTKFGIFQGGE